jgi:hypothetical protein
MRIVTSPATKSKSLAEITANRDLLSRPEGELLQRILDSENPGELVRRLPAEDLFWVVKRIGEEESLALLEVASEEQWQYLVDLDVWRKDILSPEKALDWLRLLAEADPERLSAWLLNEDQTFPALLLFRMAEVVIKDDDDADNLPGDWFTMDGRFFVKAFHEEDQETIERLLTTLGKKDHELYQELLFNLASINPAEAEEDLYRLRNNRIAEHGFLPFEEAIAVYAPLDAGAIAAEKPPLLPGRLFDEDERGMIPALPLKQMGKDAIFSRTVSLIADPTLRDRVSLEFAALVNQLIVAANLPEISDPDILAYSGRQAAGYLNVVLERLCGQDINHAENLLRAHTLLTLFRTGYGYAVSLKRKTRQWRKASWFFGQSLKNEFWGTPWGETLDGLLMEHPCFFAGNMNAEPFREFTNAGELDESEKRLCMVQAIDRLLARLSLADVHLRQDYSREKGVHPLFFTRWAHKILGNAPSFAPLSKIEAARFFGSLRAGEEHPPYRLSAYRELFIADFMEGAPDFEPEVSRALREALEIIWDDFTREYENIAEKDLEGRYSPFLHIVS